MTKKYFLTNVIILMLGSFTGGVNLLSAADGNILSFVGFVMSLIGIMIILNGFIKCFDDKKDEE